MYDLRPTIRTERVSVVVNGRTISVPAGSSAAAAVLTAGSPLIRKTPVTGAPRLPYCMMGVCFDCLATIDGVPNQQSCMVEVVEGMEIAVQEGPRMPPGANENEN